MEPETLNLLLEQLRTLYGHAVTDVLPIVLNAISLIFIAKFTSYFISTLVAVSLTLVLFKSSYAIKIIKEDPIILTFGSLLYLIGIFMMFTIVEIAALAVCHALAPHTYIVLQLLERVN